MNEMELQDRQYELDGASNVYVGPPGADGITPTVIVEDITGGHQVSFYYGAGDSRNKSFTVPNGQNGTNGADGITPSMNVSDITGGHRLSVYYAAGDSRNFTVDILNGENGATPSFSIGTVTTGEAGSSASASITGTAENPVLNLTIPRGDKGEEGGGLFIVTITGSGSYTRTSDKTPAQIKAAYDAGMTVIANIAASNTIAYLYQSTASRAEFRTLPLTGMSNDYPSMMWQEFNLAGASTTTVNITYTSVTSAESLVGKVQPHVAFRIEWNDGDYLPEMLTWFDASDWDSFYYGNLGTVVAYLQSVEYVNNEPQNTTFISRKVWETVEYDSEYGDNVNVGNIIFMHTEVDGQTLRTTEIHWKHYIWNDRMEITKRITAECSVTATTDYPQKWDPQ